MYYHKNNAGYKTPQIQYFKSVIISEYNGYPIIILNADSWYNKFSFGIKKAKAFLSKIEELKTFISSSDSEINIDVNGSAVPLTKQQANFIINNEIEINSFIQEGVIA